MIVIVVVVAAAAAAAAAIVVIAIVVVAIVFILVFVAAIAAAAVVVIVIVHAVVVVVIARGRVPKGHSGMFSCVVTLDAIGNNALGITLGDNNTLQVLVGRCSNVALRDGERHVRKVTVPRV